MKRLFLVGAAKCGTTSLYNYLDKHPELFFSTVKEPNFYSNVIPLTNSEKTTPIKGKKYHSKVINDITVYEGLFDGADPLKHKYLCEASTSYLYDSLSAKRISQHYPGAKILIMIRNPVERAFSHYKMYFNSGVEKNRDFLTALKADERADQKVLGRDFAYIDLGRYYHQISRYMNYFPPSQIHIIVFEDFVKDPLTHLNQIAKFLDITSNVFKKIDFTKKHNVGAKPKNGLVKKLFFLKNKYFFLTEWIPQTWKDALKRSFFVKDHNLQISREAIDFIHERLGSDIESLKEYVSEETIEKYLTK